MGVLDDEAEVEEQVEENEHVVESAGLIVARDSDELRSTSTRLELVSPSDRVDASRIR